MSAVFNGTNGHLLLSEAIAGATPNYPVLVLMRYKPDNVTTDQTLVCLGDNVADPNFDELTVRLRGNVANDPVTAVVTANGAFSVADLIGSTAGAWATYGALFTSASSRQAIRGNTLGTAQTTSRAVGGLSTLTIGCTRKNDLNTLFAAGRGADVGIWVGFTAGDAADIVNEYDLGRRPINIATGRSQLVLYQPFVAGVNESTKVGSDLTPANMTYDSADHPVLLGYPTYAYQMMMGAA